MTDATFADIAVGDKVQEQAYPFTTFQIIGKQLSLSRSDDYITLWKPAAGQRAFRLFALEFDRKKYRKVVL